MRKLAHWIGALLLVLLGSSCLATGAVIEWAWAPAVRTEVLGYVESDAGASLIVSLDDAVGFQAGVFEVPVVQSDTKHLREAAPASFVARRLGEDELAEFQRARGASRRVGRLPGTYPWDEALREHVDVFQRTKDGLRRQEPEGPRTFVALVPEWGSNSSSRPDAPELAFVVVQRKESRRKLTRVLGIAAVAPETIRPWRTVPAVCVLPATFAFDIVTSPVQAVYVLHGWGEALQRTLERMRRDLVFPLVILCGLLSSADPELYHFGALPFRVLTSPSVSSPVPVIVMSSVEWSWVLIWILGMTQVPADETSSPAN